MAKTQKELFSPALDTWLEQPDNIVAQSQMALCLAKYHPELRSEDLEIALGVAIRSLRRFLGYTHRNYSYLTRAVRFEKKHLQKQRFLVVGAAWLTQNAPETISWSSRFPVLDRSTWDDIRRTHEGFAVDESSYEHFRQTYNRVPRNPLDTIPYVSTVTAYNAVQAIERVDKAYNAWRGLCKLHRVPLSQIRFGLPGPAYSIARIPPMLVYSAAPSAAPAQWVPSIPQPPGYGRGELTDETLSRVRDLQARLGSTPRFRAHCLDCLLQLCAGLDASTFQESFLYLWQTIEAAVLGREIMGDTREVARRASFLVGRDALTDLTLNALAELRNRLVHEGQFPQDQLHVMSGIRYVATVVMARLVFNCERFGDVPTLREFLRNCRRDTASVMQLQRALELVSEVAKSESGSI